VYAHNDTGRGLRVFYQRRNNAFWQAQGLTRLNTSASSHNIRNFSKKLIVINGRVWLRHRVSASQQRGTSVAAFRHDPMSKKTAVAAEQNYVSFGNGRTVDAIDKQCVTRSNCRKHA